MLTIGNAVQILIIANLFGYLLELVLPIEQWIRLALIPQDLISHGYVWQLVTYMFLHAPFPSLWHILFNMFALWMFGNPLERVWGFRRFLIYYFVTGIGAGLITLLVSLIAAYAGDQSSLLTPNIGASGAIYGLLLAFAMLFPEQPVLVFFCPLPAKYAVLVMGALAFFSGMTGFMPTIGHFAHLGGLLVGFLFLKWQGWGSRY